MQDILKSRKSKKRSLYSIEKPKSYREKEIRAKLDAEAKAYLAAHPPSADELLEAKCKANDDNELACKALAPECFFETYTKKCKKSNRPPPQQQQGMAIGAPPGLFNLPTIAPSADLGQKTL